MQALIILVILTQTQSKEPTFYYIEPESNVPFRLTEQEVRQELVVCWIKAKVSKDKYDWVFGVPMPNQKKIFWMICYEGTILPSSCFRLLQEVEGIGYKLEGQRWVRVKHEGVPLFADPPSKPKKIPKAEPEGWLDRSGGYDYERSPSRSGIVPIPPGIFPDTFLPAPVVPF